MKHNINRIHFVGIGGSGMSGIAEVMHNLGYFISGSDIQDSPVTSRLKELGIKIFINHAAENIKDIDVIVISSAIDKDNSELKAAIKNKIPIMPRAEMLSELMRFKKGIAVAGTHGKTTTTSLIASILAEASMDPTYVIGGRLSSLNANAKLGNGEYIVVEADEYDRSFLTLHPEMAVITSVDADHLDIYGDKKFVEESYSLFARQVRSKLILKKNIVSKVDSGKQAITYSVNDDTADFFAQEIKIENGAYHYEIVTPTTIFSNMTLGLPGLHNVENSIAAVAIACQMNIQEEIIRKAFASFRGVRRRFDYHIKTDKLVYIDDYAHHPEELKATISSVKEMYPGKKITGVFQPHLFSRTRDFADDFARSLDLLDECILMEIYPARELPIEGVTSQLLLDKMRSTHKTICQKTDLVKEISSRQLDVLITLGAGDIDTFVDPITKALNSKN